MSLPSRRVLVVALVALACAATFPVLASGGSTGAQRYLIMMPHSKEQCLKALDNMNASSKDLLAKTDWGCMAGDHTGYMIIEAASEKAAREMVPEGERSAAKVIPLNKFTPEQIRVFHQK